jgi:hypothetical protein
LDHFVPVTTAYYDSVPRAAVNFCSVAAYELSLVVRAARASYLLDGGMRLQLNFRALSEVAVDSFVVGVPICEQTFSQHWPRQTLRYNTWIVSEGLEKFVEHFRLFGVLRHAIHFRL